MSSIFTCYESGFGGTESAVIEHLKHYARRELAAWLAAIDHISDDRYDWALNGLKQ